MNKFSKQSFLDYSVVWFVLRTYEVNKLLMNIIELKQTKWYEKSNKNKMQAKSNEKTSSRTNSFVASVRLQIMEKSLFSPTSNLVTG